MLSKIFSAGATELVKNVGGVLDNLTTTKEEKLAAEAKIKDMIMGYEAEMQKQVTERWKMVIGAYFGGRSLEKVKK